MINRATKSQVRAGRMNPRLACDTIIIHGSRREANAKRKSSKSNAAANMVVCVLLIPTLVWFLDVQVCSTI
jgi:hypothetical protein